jgi:putative transposase
MARKARIEYAGAYYHVINRGNDRSWIFESDGARQSFLECLVQACESMGWRVHAWCLMGNHYHLCLQTPEPNLVEGMRWLQSTFANRFNRFRKSNGHVFQGRYQAILLDGDAVAAVCHYIHLNPVRAGLIEAARLQEYKDSSFHQLWNPRKRWGFAKFGSCLEAAGGLADKPKGRVLYRDYLEWLSTDDPERKRLGFEKMSRGWAKGGNTFKKAVLENLEAGDQRNIVEAEASEMREPRWENGLKQALRLLGKGESDLLSGRKGADWKVALARYLRERYLAPHQWIAQRLSMGQVSSVNSLVSRHRKLNIDSDPDWGKLKNQQYLD